MTQRLRYTLLVNGPVYGTQQATSAYQFASTVIAQKQVLDIIFFYQDGVTNGNGLLFPASDEFNLLDAWQQLHADYHVPLMICSSAAFRRGILNQQQAQWVEKSANLSGAFTLSSLATLAESILATDRLIQF